MKITHTLKSGLASLALAGALLCGAGCSSSNPAIPAGSYTGMFALTVTGTPASISTKADPVPDFLAAGMIQATVSDSGSVSGAITLFDDSLDIPATVDFPNPALFGHTYLISGDADADGFTFASDLMNIYGTDLTVTGEAAFQADGSILGTLSGTIDEAGTTLGGAVGGIANDSDYMSVACGGFGFGSEAVGGTEGFAGFIMHGKSVYALLASDAFVGSLNLAYTGDVSGPCGVDTGCAEGTGDMSGTADIPAGDPETGFTGDVALPATYGFYQTQNSDWQTTFTSFSLEGSLGDETTDFTGGFGGSTEGCINDVFVD